MAASTKPKIIYFDFQGRAEVLRLALAAAGVEFDFEAVHRTPDIWGAAKKDLDSYHFGQVPRYIDDEVDMCQSEAILRHIGRTHGLYGASRAEQARVDEVIDGSADLAVQLFIKYAMHKEEPDSKESYWQQHCDPASASAPGTLGAHAAFLSRLLGKSSSGYSVESGLTIADIQVAVIVELHMLVYGRDRFAQQWPDLVALLDRVLALPRVAAYRQGPQCPPVVAPMLA